MSKTIQYFMWEYQHIFRILLESKAKELFQNLDESLQPEVFLVGMLADKSSASRHQSCVEPEDDFWIHSNDFRTVGEVSQGLIGQYPESNLIHSHPIAQENEDRSLQVRSIRDAIRQNIETHQARPENRRFYVSLPAEVQGYWVCTVLSLQDDIIALYPALLRDTVQLHEDRSYPLPVSFLDAVTEQFLRYACEELSKPEPCNPTHIDNENLLRDAGAALARNIVPRMSDKLIGQGYYLFRDCSTISSLRYERSAGSGRILLATNDHPAIEPTVTFASPVELRDHRAARKLLQLSFDSISLHSDSNQIWGLAEVGEYDNSKEDLFEVQILGHHHWELRHNDSTLMTVRYGVPSLPKLGLDEQAFRSNVTRIFKNISDFSTNRLLSLVKEAEQASHGTMLLISTVAEEEAKRLASQGTPITPCLMTSKLLKHLTPIDGAILLDSKGMCYAIGTILDGQATTNGDPSRGARFNSAVRYVESALYKARCLAVIVSEDGGIDFVPDLPPPIKRSTIDEAIAELKRQESTDQFGIRRYRKTLNWLEEHRFYLTPADCNFLNKLVPKLEDRFKQESESQISIVQEPFEPNPAMDEELFYENESDS